MARKRCYIPARDRPHDADLCVEMDDGSWRDGAGRLIYQPRSNISIGSHVRMWRDDHSGEVGGIAQTQLSDFRDDVWEEYMDYRRTLAPEPFFPASLEGIAAWLKTQC